METPILFLILAVLLIAILVGCSLWSARREKSRVFSNTFSTRPPSTPINTNLDVDMPNFNRQHGNDSAQNTAHPITGDFAQTQQEVEYSIKNIRISLPEQGTPPTAKTTDPFTEQSKSDFYQQNNMQNYPDNAYMAQPQPIEQHYDYATQPESKMQMSNEQIVPEPHEDTVNQTNAEPEKNPEIISLYVVAAEGQQFYGNDIIQCLEALGFHYGEYQIFHRHLNNTITNPVLFSVANMMQPGIFDMSTMDQFSTVGLVFFMHVPSGNDLVNLRLMLRTVKSFAESMDGFILDENRQLFDENTREDYLLRVKMPN